MYFIVPEILRLASRETGVEGCPACYSEPEGVVVFSAQDREEGVDRLGNGLAEGGSLGLVC